MSYSFLVLQQPNTTGADVKTHRMMFGGASRFLGAVANDPTTPFQCPAAPTQSSPNTSLDFKKTGVVLAPSDVSTIDALFSATQSFIGTYMQKAADGQWQQTSLGTWGWQQAYTPLGLEAQAFLGSPADTPLRGWVQAALWFLPDAAPARTVGRRALAIALDPQSLDDPFTPLALKLSDASFSASYTNGKFEIGAGGALHLVGTAELKDSKKVPHAVLYGQFTDECSPLAFAVVGTP